MKNKYDILDKGYVEYKTHLGGDLDPVQAARISTGKESGLVEAEDDRLRDYLYRHQHVSCFEYNILRVEVKVPIFISRQIIRHRTLDITDLTEGIPTNISVNEYSGRYAKLIEECYIPELDRILGESKVNKQSSEEELPPEDKQLFQDDCKTREILFGAQYDKHINMGVAKELSRINAPVSNYTVLLLQGNLRNWLHFINLRIKPNAQYEIRVVAESILKMVEELWPKCYESFLEHTLNAENISAKELQTITSLINSLYLNEEEFDVICGRNNLNKSLTRELKQKLKLKFN